MAKSAYENILTSLDEGHITDLCTKLIRFDTVNPPGRERACAEYAGEYLAEVGFEVEYLHHSDDRSSLIARWRGAGERDAVVWCGHLDVVPVGWSSWEIPPFAGEQSRGRVWGRGSADMKGGIASMLAAARSLVRSGLELKGDLIVALTAGEEADQLGASEMVEKLDLSPVGVLMISEPTENEIYLAEKGALWLEFTAHGKSAHGSMPQLGENAILAMLHLIEVVESMEFPHEEHPLLGGFTRNVGVIEGGERLNIVPDRCSAQFDLRTVPGQEHEALLDKIRGQLHLLEERMQPIRFDINVLNDLPPIATNSDSAVVQSVSRAWKAVRDVSPTYQGATYFTDGAVISPAWEVPLILLGPGSPGQAHQTDESVEIARLLEAAEMYLLSAINLLCEPLPT